MSAKSKNLPLVYSCSGVSNVAQLANSIAVSLDREGTASMSCIAGVGGDVPGLVRVATSGRPILALDGCPLQCVKSCLARHNIEPTIHHVFTNYGLRKRADGSGLDADDAADVRQRVLDSLAVSC
jgi:uncharacterized metal-binding protein